MEVVSAINADHTTVAVWVIQSRRLPSTTGGEGEDGSPGGEGLEGEPDGKPPGGEGLEGVPKGRPPAGEGLAGGPAATS